MVSYISTVTFLRGGRLWSPGLYMRSYDLRMFTLIRLKRGNLHAIDDDIRYLPGSMRFRLSMTA